ncbi:MAG: ABC transporter ATP-binding protein [Phycisphaeraceae bacterium]|nr:ABC transporter ATP-binding protein [Phycisphaeraceae bacterium]
MGGDATEIRSTPPVQAPAAPLAGPSIVTRGLTRRYRSGERVVEALRGIDFELREARFHAVMGASGSGKSTLLHLLAGLDRADGGEIEVNGERVDRMDERDLTLYRRRRIGVVFQSFNLLPTLSALENVALPGVLDGLPRRACHERAAELLRDLGLGGRLDHRPDALSGGEQQRVAIARSLYFAPPVLFADEPTGNLDSASSERVWEALEALAATRRMMVLMVTHEPTAAVRCSGVTVLRDGQVAGRFDTEGMHAGDLAVRAAELAGASR